MSRIGRKVGAERKEVLQRTTFSRGIEDLLCSACDRAG